ncbi:right-handed parallel beta-helix repeat-containing protein [Patescibacteria group bacterium]
MFGYKRKIRLIALGLFMLPVFAVAQALVGDISDDGVVDTIDLDIMRLNFGTEGTPAQGDIYGTSIIDALDLALLMLHWGERQEPASEFYVATNGNDSWSGTLAAPNDAGTDGPFESITKARDAVRQIQPKTEPIIIYIREGRYFIDETITFEPQDSGNEQAPITYQAFEEETPIISGGIEITNWVQDPAVGPNVWKASVPGDASFKQLFVNGNRRYRARTPNVGSYYRVDQETDTPTTTFKYENNDINADWAGNEDLQVVFLNRWITHRHRISDVNRGTNNATITPPIPRAERPDLFPLVSKTRYYVENIFSGLDSDGEWYLDEDADTVFYISSTADMNAQDVVAPIVRTLMETAGDHGNGAKVQYINFRGLTFHHGSLEYEENSNAVAMTQNAAIKTTGFHNGVFENCEIAHVGESGIWLSRGTENVTLRGNNIFDTGIHGVRVADHDINRTAVGAAKNNNLENNFIHNVSNIFNEGTGIIVGLTQDSTIKNNHICGTDYSGIATGNSIYGFDASPGKKNIEIAYNHIENVGRGVLSDLGGFRNFGTAYEMKLHHNIIHDIQGKSSPIVGIYPDQFTSSMLIENNIVYDAPYGMHNHLRDNTQHAGTIMKNNVFHNEKKEFLSTYCSSRYENHLHLDFQNNIVMSDNGMKLEGDWLNADLEKPCNYEIDNNLYWISDPSRQDNYDWPRVTNFNEWQSSGNDVHSIIADPKFVNADNHNYDLQGGSPASQIGFQEIDTSNIGLRGIDEWTNLPEQFCSAPSDHGN